MHMQLADWLLVQWMEVASLLIAIFALIFAALAYHLAKQADESAKISDTLNLRGQANSALTKATSKFLILQEDCRMVKDSWDIYKRKHLPSLGRSRLDVRNNTEEIERHGAAILSKTQQKFGKVDNFNSEQLMQLIETADASKLEFERLSGRLERPPTIFN